METIKVNIDDLSDIGAAVIDATELLDYGEEIRLTFHEGGRFMASAHISCQGEVCTTTVTRYDVNSDEGISVTFTSDGDYPTPEVEAEEPTGEAAFWADHQASKEPVCIGTDSPAAKAMARRARVAEAIWQGRAVKARGRKPKLREVA